MTKRIALEELKKGAVIEFNDKAVLINTDNKILGTLNYRSFLDLRNRNLIKIVDEDNKYINRYIYNDINSYEYYVGYWVNETELDCKYGSYEFIKDFIDNADSTIELMDNEPQKMF